MRRGTSGRDFVIDHECKTAHTFPQIPIQHLQESHQFSNIEIRYTLEKASFLHETFAIL